MQNRIGIFDLPNDVYQASPALSRSGVVEINRSLFHFYKKYISCSVPKKETKDMMLGTALHCAVLEPDRYVKTYTSLPLFNKRTKVGRENYETFLEGNKDRIFLDNEDIHQVGQWKNAILENPFAKKLLSNTVNEQSIFWENKETGVYCRCRPDAMNKDYIVDVKTTIDASERAFSKSCYTWGYDIQAAMIQDAIHTLEDRWINDFYFILVEKSYPFAVAIYRLDERSIERGRNKFISCAVKFNDKRKSPEEDWNSYEIKDISLPNYAFFS